MSEELKAAQARIACLEGEIAKRDARIVELDDLVLSLQCKVIERDGELDAIKAQEPVAWAGAIEYGVPLLMVEPQNWKATPLYAAPVSEAKAQDTVGEVVGWYRLDRPYEMTSYPSVCATWHRLGAPVAPLYAAHAQQVSVPDGWKLVPVEPTPEMVCAAEEAHMPFGDMDIALRMAILSAPSAPAADASDVLEQAMYTLISIGYHENSGLVHELRQALAAHSANGSCDA